MDNQPSAKTNLLDLMSPEDAAKVERRSALREATKNELITDEWMILAELGTYYGFGAIMAVVDDTITIQQAKMLIQGARKVHSSDVYDAAIAGLAANVHKTKDFVKIMKPYINDMKVAQ